MTTITFTIPGNQEDPDGNPVPYFRTTQGSKWSDGARRYQRWKQYVAHTFLDATHTDEMRGAAASNLVNRGKPIELKPTQRAEVILKVYWANRAYGDLDNIIKSILDALFVNDKNVNRIEAIADMAEDHRGRVEVIISIDE